MSYPTLITVPTPLILKSLHRPMLRGANGKFEIMPEGMNWLCRYGKKIDEERFRKFLQDISPALSLLLLAGYQVPWFEIKLSWGPNRPSEDSGLNICRRIRFDLKNTEIEVIHDQYEQIFNEVVVNFEPITTRGVKRAIPVNGNEVDIACNRFNNNTYPGFKTLMTAVLDEYGIKGVRRHPSYNDASTETLLEYRRNLLKANIDKWGKEPTRFFLKFEDTSADNLFQSVKDLVFDSLALLAMDLIKKKFPVGTDECGMLELLDPAHWYIGHSDRLSATNEEKALRSVGEYYHRLFTNFRSEFTNSIANSRLNEMLAMQERSSALIPNERSWVYRIESQCMALALTENDRENWGLPKEHADKVRKIVNVPMVDTPFDTFKSDVDNLLKGSWLEVLITLINTSIVKFPSIDLEEEDAYEEHIEFSKSGNTILLKRPGRNWFKHEEVITIHHTHPLGRTLMESFSWEYIPKPARDMQAYRFQGSSPLDYSRNRLVIIAAPGVYVDIGSNFDPYVKVEVIRVQCHELVPPWGSPIDLTNLLKAQPYDITTYFADVPSNAVPIPETDVRYEYQYDKDILSGSRKQVLLDYLNGNRGFLPQITIEPFWTDAESGVHINYNRPTDIHRPHFEHENTLRLNLGLSFDFARDENMRVSISVTNKEMNSAQQRFAFSIVPRFRMNGGGKARTIASSTAAPSTYSDHHVLDYTIVVYRTEGVKIAGVNHTDIPFSYRFYDLMDITNVPPHGTPLAYDYVNRPTLALPQTFIDNRIGDTRGTKPDNTLVLPTLNNQEVEAARKENFRDWVFTFADIGIGMIPMVGDYADILELAASLKTGTDKWGRPISNMDRIFMLGGTLMPFVSTSTLRKMKGVGGDIVDTIASQGRGMM